jgi:hypothetical protein
MLSLFDFNDTSLELCFNEVFTVCRFDEELDQLVSILLGHHEVDGFSFDDISIDNKKMKSLKNAYICDELTLFLIKSLIH